MGLGLTGWTLGDLDCPDKSMLNSMLANKDFLTWLLIGWRLCCQPIRCQVWISLPINMEFDINIFLVTQAILKKQFSTVLYWLVSTYRRMIMPSHEFHGTFLMISYHWFKLWLWCHLATGHYLSQCWSSFISPYGVTRPQWFDTYRPEHFADCRQCQLHSSSLDRKFLCFFSVTLRFVFNYSVDNRS